MRTNLTQCRSLSRLSTLFSTLLLLPLLTFSLSAQQATTFVVTVDDSTPSNPNGNNANPEVFYIDGAESPELTLTRGTTYTFVMDNVPVIHPFYISTSTTGGGASMPYSDGVQGQFATGTDTLRFTPGTSTPNLLYYQCAAHQYMGWKINVVGETAEDTVLFRALLAADNEVPAVESSASGSVTAILVGGQLTLEGNFEGLTSSVLTSLAGGAHIHRGYAGQNGPVEQPLTVGFSGNDSTAGTFAVGANTFTLTESQQIALLERRLYVNVHSATYPGGELRGQLLPASAEVYTAVLSGRAEVPANMSRAWGGAVIERYGDTIVVSGSFTGLDSPLATNTAGGGHIHLADHDTNGPIIFPLSISTLNGADTSAVLRADSNRFVLSGDQIEAFLGMRTYINIHSMNRLGGEIRGQIVPNDAVVFEAWLAGQNEVTSNMSAAEGGVIAILNGRQLMVGGNFTGLESNLAVNISGGAHIHRGGPDENGPVLFPLSVQTSNQTSGAFRVESNSFALSPSGIDSLRQGMLYVNVHSENHQGGEIRGQLLPAVNRAPSVTSIISPAPGSTIPIPTDTNETLMGLWNAATDLNGNELTYTWQIASDATFNEVLFSTPPTTDTSFSFSFGEILRLLDEAGIDPNVVGPLTVNHRVIASDGSLWSVSATGQVTLGEEDLPEGGFRAMLAGHNEVPAVESRASGSVSARVVGDTLKVSGNFDNLGSAVATAIGGGAHIHIGSAGMNGPIAFGLNMTLHADQMGGSFSEAQNSFVLTSDQMTALMQRRMYVNVHTLGMSSGEIRGQIVPSTSVLYRTNLSGRAENPGNMSVATGSALLEIRGGDTLGFSGAFSGLGSSLMPISGSAAHIHSGDIDANGSVLLPLQGLPATGVEGPFPFLSVVAPTGLIDPMLLDSAGLYVNVHTTGFPGGEIRGQIVPADNEIMEAWLSSQNEVVADGQRRPASGATGSVIAVLDSNRLRLGGSFDGLSSAFSAAHIHMAAPGTNGGVEIALDVTTGSGGTSGTFEADANAYTLTSAQIDALLDGRMYVNVHSANYPGGEIRGQLLVSTNLAPGAATLIGPAENDVVTLDSELNGSLDVIGRTAVDPNGNEVVYLLELSNSATFDATSVVTIGMSDTAGSVSFTALAAAADTLGIELDEDGESLFARFVVTDGSLRNVSAVTEFTVRTEISGVAGETGADRLLQLDGVVPNPVTREGTLLLTLDAPAKVSLEIYDETGRLLEKRPSGLLVGGEHVLELATDRLGSGTYHYRVVATVRDRTEVAGGSFTVLR